MSRSNQTLDMPEVRTENASSDSGTVLYCLLFVATLSLFSILCSIYLVYLYWCLSTLVTCRFSTPSVPFTRYLSPRIAMDYPMTASSSATQSEFTQHVLTPPISAFDFDPMVRNFQAMQFSPPVPQHHGPIPGTPFDFVGPLVSG